MSATAPTIATERTDNPDMSHWSDPEGRLHRVDGPAVETSDGYQAWYRHGILHRDDGPARQFPDGRQQWWINGSLVRSADPPGYSMDTDRSGWYYEPADPDVGIMYDSWCHEECPIGDGWGRLDGINGCLVCEACGAEVDLGF